MAKREVVDLVTTLKMDTKAFVEGAGNVEKALKNTKSVMRDFDREIKLGANSSEVYAKKQQLITKEAELLTRKEEDLIKALEKKKQTIMDTTKSATFEEAMLKATDAQINSVNKLESELIRVESQKNSNRLMEKNFAAEVAKSNSLIDEQSKKLKDNADKWNTRSKNASTTSATQANISTGLGNVSNTIDRTYTAPMAIAAVAAVRGYMNWEVQTDAVTSTSSGTEEEKEQVRKDMLETYKNNTLSAEQVQEVYSAIGQAGVSMASYPEYVKALIDYQNISGLALDTLSDTVLQAKNQLAFTDGEGRKFVSALAEGGRSGASSDAAVAEMVNRMIGTSTQGVSNANLVAGATFISSAGINAESGGTSITSLLTNMKTIANSMAEYQNNPIFAKFLNESSAKDLEMLQAYKDTGSNKDSEFAGYVEEMVSKFGITANKMTEITEANGQLLTMSKISGLGTDEFISKTNADPMVAFGEFLKGAKRGSDAGTLNIDSMMDALNINSSQEQDLIRKSVNQADIWDNIFSSVNAAYEVGTVAEERAAEKMDNATARATKAKHEFDATMIKLGESLMPVMNDAFEMLTPLLKEVQEGVEWFTNLDEESRKFYLKLLMIPVAASAVIRVFSLLFGGLSVFNGAYSAFSGLVGKSIEKKLATNLAEVAVSGKTSTGILSSLFGLFNNNKKSIADTAVDMAGMSTALSGAGSGALGASSAVGGLSASLAALAPILGIVGGLALAGVIGYSIVKSVESYNESIADAKRWGTELNDEIQKDAEEYKAITIETKTDIKNSYSYEVDESTLSKIDADLEKENEKVKEYVNSKKETYAVTLTGDMTNEESLNWSNTEKARLDDMEVEYIDLGNQMSAIYAVAKDEARELNSLEMGQLEAISKKRDDIYVKIQEQNEATKQQLSKGYSDTWAVGDDKGVMKERKDVLLKQFESEQKDLLAKRDSILNSTELSDAAKQDQLGALALAHADLSKTTSEEYYDLNKALGDTEHMALDRMEELNISDVFENGVDAQSLKSYRAVNDYKGTLLYELGVIEDETTLAAASIWNGIFEPATADVLSKDPLAPLKDYLNGPDGLAGIQQVINGADLSKDVRSVITNGLMENGNWSALSKDEKSKLVKSDSTQVALDGLESTKVWESLDFEQKQAVIQSNSAEEVQSFILASETWEKIPFEDRNAYLKTNLTEEQFKTADMYNYWTNAEFQTKLAEIRSNSGDASAMFNGFVNQWNGRAIDPKRAEINIVGKSSLVTFLSDIGILDSKKKEYKFSITALFNTIGTASKNFLYDLFNPDASAPKTPIDYDYANYKTYARGTSYHSGGLAILGDGGKSEPFLTPSGFMGLSPSNDTLYNLPTGTKVWSSLEKLKRELPRFATGTDRSFLDRLTTSKTTANNYEFIFNVASGGDLNDAIKNDLINEFTDKLDRMERQVRQGGGF